MWFKNLQIYTLPKRWDMTADRLADLIESQRFEPCTSSQMSTMGWVPPRENGGLVHGVGSNLMLCLGYEKKLLPTSVVNQYAKQKAQELEEKQGFSVGRKQMKELKELAMDELLPRAFSTTSSLWVWIDPVNGWMIIDSSSASKSEDVLKLLIAAIDKFPIAGLRTKHSPATSMTTWLQEDEAPGGFTVDQDAELVSTGEEKSKVKYVRQTLEQEDMQKHISTGKQCSNLAMTWDSRISFVLTENLIIKRFTPLDIITESEDNNSELDADARFDADVTLMAGELNRFLPDMIEMLGGVLGAEEGL